MRKVYVCYASSDFYARETGISMLGFLDNNPDYVPDRIIILDYGILDHNKEKLNNIASRYGKIIEYVDAKGIMEKVQEELHLSDFRGSLATYSRAFIDKLMPEYVEDVLYIDSDTVVVGSVNDIYTINMEDKCMAGIIHTGFYDNHHSSELTLLNGNTKYFGCGVVLFNIRNWKKFGCFEMIAQTLAVKEDYPFADQTLINNAIPETLFQILPLQFNYTTHIYNPKWEKRMLLQGGWYTSDEASYAINHPVVIHYPGSPFNRPWYSGCLSYRKNDYLYYKSMSPWRDEPLMSMEEYLQGNRGLGGRLSIIIHHLKAESKSYSLFKMTFLLYELLGKTKRALKRS